MSFKTYKYRLPFKPNTVNNHWVIINGGKVIQKRCTKLYKII